MTREEAINKIRQMSLPKETMDILEALAPELTMSEDEMMIYELQGFLSSFGSDYFGTGEWQKFDDWLEKQKKQKLNPDKEELIRPCIGSILTDATDKRFKDYDLTLKDCLTWLDEQKEQKLVECIEFDNEFENQVSHLLASVLNGEWEYDEGFVKHAAQSLLGYAKNEIRSGELDKIEKLMKALQATNAQIGELIEENYKLKEQKSAQSDAEKEYVRILKSVISDFVRDRMPKNTLLYQDIFDWLDGRHVEQEEQKPTEIDEYEIIKKHITGDALSSEVNKRLNECGWYVTDEKPEEWSKNDTVFLNEITDFLESKTVRLQHDLDMYAHWLKSLPERFNLESKEKWSGVTINGEPISIENKSVNIPLAEWSEEDEATYDAFMCEVVNEKMNLTIEQVKWLRSIRDRLKFLHSSWKPSEEQMKALHAASSVASLGEYVQRHLVSLHNDLMKRM